MIGNILKLKTPPEDSAGTSISVAPLSYSVPLGENSKEFLGDRRARGVQKAEEEEYDGEMDLTDLVDSDSETETEHRVPQSMSAGVREQMGVAQLKGRLLDKTQDKFKKQRRIEGVRRETFEKVLLGGEDQDSLEQSMAEAEENLYDLPVQKDSLIKSEQKQQVPQKPLKVQRYSRSDLNAAILNGQYEKALQMFKSNCLLFAPQTIAEINQLDPQGYTLLHLAVLRTLFDRGCLSLARSIADHPSANPTCLSRFGWSALQDAIYYRHIPLTVHLFRANYFAKTKAMRASLSELGDKLGSMEDFRFEVGVNVSSYVPLVGALAPEDTLTVTKKGRTLRIDYSLVSFQFLKAKRRPTSLLVQDGKLYCISHTKTRYCDLLQEIDSEEMAMLIEDLLVSESRKIHPIFHSVALTKAEALFFFQEGSQRISGVQTLKHDLKVVYTSFTEKRRPQRQTTDLLTASDEENYFPFKEVPPAKQKNVNKQLELSVNLGRGFGLKVSEMMEVLGVLCMENGVWREVLGFVRQHVMVRINQHEFPMRMQIPIGYSFYVEIQFGDYHRDVPDIKLAKEYTLISRKEFQNIKESKSKRKVFAEVYM